MIFNCEKEDDVINNIIDKHDNTFKSRKMDERTDDIIREESEDAQSFTTDSFVDEEVGGGRQEEEELEDYTSLAFERDLEANSRSYR